MGVIYFSALREHSWMTSRKQGEEGVLILWLRSITEGGRKSPFIHDVIYEWSLRSSQVKNDLWSKQWTIWIADTLNSGHFELARPDISLFWFYFQHVKNTILNRYLLDTFVKIDFLKVASSSNLNLINFFTAPSDWKIDVKILKKT